MIVWKEYIKCVSVKVLVVFLIITCLWSSSGAMDSGLHPSEVPDSDLLDKPSSPKNKGAGKVSPRDLSRSDLKEKGGPRYQLMVDESADSGFEGNPTRSIGSGPR